MESHFNHLGRRKKVKLNVPIFSRPQQSQRQTCSEWAPQMLRPQLLTESTMSIIRCRAIACNFFEGLLPQHRITYRMKNYIKNSTLLKAEVGKKIVFL